MRPLYLAWLAYCFDEESLEPPVPPGLGRTDRALEVLAEYYELSPDMIAAAAEQSPPLSKKPDKKSAGTKWVESLSKLELKQIVHDLITGDAVTIQADVRTQIRKSTPVSQSKTVKASRTLQQLEEAAKSVQRDRKKRENAAKQRARKKHLQSVAADPKKLIRRIDTLVAGRSRDSYHQVADCLTDLAEALGEGPGPTKARQIAQKLRQRKPRSNVLIGVLRTRGWIE